MHRSKHVIAALLLLCSPALADEPSPGLSLELNTQESSQAGCLLTFMVTNPHPQDIKSAIFETVLLNTDGQVDRLTLFDFGALPANRPRVRQFQLDGLACEDLAKVLINGVNTCDARGAQSDLCDSPETSSRTGTEVIG